MFYLRCKGHNMQEIANIMGVSRITINRHFLELKKMKEEDFQVLIRDTFYLSFN